MKNAKTRDSILWMFFNSFRSMAINSETENNGRVTDVDLDPQERKIVNELRKMNRLPSLTEVDPKKANRLNKMMGKQAANWENIAKGPDYRVKGHRVIEEDGDRDR